MRFKFSDADLAFQMEIREFIRENLPPEMAVRQRRSSLPGNWDDMLAWTRILHRQGWSVPQWPVEYGGTGWTPLQHFIFDREIAQADAPGLMLTATAMVGPVIYTFGTPEQKERFLPSIQAGEHAWSQGFSEPGSGSDLASLRTTAVLRGDRYRVNGQKIWTSGAYEADWGFFLVRTDPKVKPQRGISFLLIDMKSRGITVRRIPQINGESHLCEVFLDDVEVPAENLVGQPGAGWTYAKFLLDNERTASAFIHWNQRELRRAKEIAEVETRNGVPLARLDSFRSRLAQLEAQTIALEWSVLRVLADEPRPYDPTAVASGLKIRGAELQQAITELQIDMLGPRSLRAFDAELVHGSEALNDPLWPEHTPGITSTALLARASTIYGGTKQVQGNIIARLAFGL